MTYKQQRKEGYIKPLKTQRVPNRFLLFDTETTYPTKENPNTKFDLKIGVAIYVETDKHLDIIKRKIWQFDTILEFVEIIEYYTHEEKMLYCFAHNIGFDIRVLNLPREFADRGYESEPPIINEMSFIWKVKIGKGKAQFLDTANLGVRSVAKLGKDLGFEKLDIDFDNCTLEDLYTYCQRDVEVLERFVLSYIEYIQDNGLGSFRVTLASQSMAALRTRFMINAPFIHINEEALKLERDGYHGGRVECYHIGDLPPDQYYYLDVNSMYPYSMIGNNLPVKFRGFSKDVNPLFLSPRLSRFYTIAEVEVITDEPVYPLVQNNKLIFPVGTFKTVLYHDELQYAISHKHINHVYRCAVYERGNVFDDYVDFFYKEKEAYTKSGNSTLRTISKLFLNSLYGKFGQLNPLREFMGISAYKDVTRLPCVNSVTGEHYQEINWYGSVYRESKEGETTLSCPAIAGAITARARMTLWNYIKLAGRENTFYCDTDSLIVNEAGYQALIPYLDETKLGYLKVEDKSTVLEIRGNKDYRFGTQVKTKGVPKHASQIDKNTWEYLQFQGFITWLNGGAIGSPTGKYTTKQRKSAYNKGVVLDSGLVIPFNLH